MSLFCSVLRQRMGEERLPLVGCNFVLYRRGILVFFRLFGFFCLLNETHQPAHITNWCIGATEDLILYSRY